MLIDHELAPGTRVRVRAPHFLLTLRSPAATVIRREEPGWYIIRLDQPAIYQASTGSCDLWEIREAGDNLDLLPPD